MIEFWYQINPKSINHMHHTIKATQQSHPYASSCRHQTQPENWFRCIIVSSSWVSLIPHSENFRPAEDGFTTSVHVFGTWRGLSRPYRRCVQSQFRMLPFSTARQAKRVWQGNISPGTCEKTLAVRSLGRSIAFQVPTAREGTGRNGSPRTKQKQRKLLLFRPWKWTMEHYIL